MANEEAIRQYLSLASQVRRQAPDTWWDVYDKLCETVRSLRAELDALYESQEHPYRGNLTIVSLEMHLLTGSSTDDDAQNQVRRDFERYGLDPATIDQRTTAVIETLLAQVLPLMRQALTTSQSAPAAPAPPRE